ncbi:endonuclease/exonuclease/phosphatase family protein [Spirochaetia bacterium]|nr:endonuclease/exonuclease/phosphatase family protein [Spirochaetia bacterium]
MKILSWNTHYGFTDKQYSAIMERFNDIDLFVIQEIKRTDFEYFQNKWKYKNWYGDDLENSRGLGVSVFSNTCKIEFTDEFNRNYRYVVPYKITTADNNIFVLFAVWTKSIPYDYVKNITNAISSPIYKNLLLENDIVIIGDYNVPYSEKNKEPYDKLIQNMEGFKNYFEGTEEEKKYTLCWETTKELFLADYCFIKGSIISKIKMSEKTYDHIDVINKCMTEDEKSQKNWFASDHKPIIIELEI